MSNTELRELAKAATPGPWSFKRHTSNLDGTHSASDDWSVYGPIGESICFEGGHPALADPEYIAAANPAKVLELLDALQSQAERIKTLERESETQAKAYGLAIVERDTLRAQLEVIEKTEPVGTVTDNFRTDYSEISRTYQKPISIGTKLFTRPMPAQKAEQILAEQHAVSGCISTLYVVDVGDTTFSVEVQSDDEFNRKNTQPAQDVGELVEALERIEWAEYDDPDNGNQTFCQECRADKKHGHIDGCKVGTALSNSKGAK